MDWKPVLPALPVSTIFDIPGKHIKRHVGPVFGITVRSRGMGANFAAGMRMFSGGEIFEYTQLANQVRHEAVERMVAEAMAIGANAVVGMRFEGSEIMDGMTEVFCYGTAVITD